MIEPGARLRAPTRPARQRGARHGRPSGRSTRSSSTASSSASTAAPSRSTGSAPTATSRPPSTATSSSTGSSTGRSPSSRCDGRRRTWRTRCSRRSGCATCSSSSSSSRASASSATSCARSTRCWTSARRSPTACCARSWRPTGSSPTGCARTATRPVDPDEIVKECVGVGRQYHLQGRIQSAEAVSSELFKTGAEARRQPRADGGRRAAVPRSRPSSRNVLEPTVTELLDTIKAAPRGRRTAAFFDFDGTMIDGYSAMAMMQHRWRKRADVAGRDRAAADGRHRGRPGPRRLRALHARRRAGVPRPPGRRHGRDGREADALGARRRAVPGGVGARRRAPREGPHGRRRLLGAAVPGRAAGARARRRARAVHAARGARRRAHRRGRRPDPVGPGQGRRRQGVRRARAASTSTRATSTPTAPRTSPFLETVGRPTALNPTKDLARIADERGVADPRASQPRGRARPRGGRAHRRRLRRPDRRPRRAGVGLGLLKRSRKAA